MQWKIVKVERAEKKLKAIRYLSVSSEAQVEGTLLAEQYAATTKKGQELNAEFVATYEDGGVSGGLYMAMTCSPKVHPF